MQLITLNTWAGAVPDALLAFVQEHAQITDIFTFQEVFEAEIGDSGHDNPYPHLLTKLTELLPDHLPFYSAGHSTEGQRMWGNATFVRSSITVTDHGDIFDEHEITPGAEFGYVPYAGLFVNCIINERPVLIYNHHGLWAKDTHKKDIPPRIEQATQITEFLSRHTGEVIMAGDFNLLPDTAAMGIYEKNLHNLVTKYNITDTRSTLYKKPVRFADYVLVSAGINDTSCQTLNVAVSDHLPLLLQVA